MSNTLDSASRITTVHCFKFCSVLEEIVDEYRGNTEAVSTARGVLISMEFLLGIVIGESYSAQQMRRARLFKENQCVLCRPEDLPLSLLPALKREVIPILTKSGKI